MEFETVRDEVAKKVREAIRNYGLFYGFVDASIFTRRDLGIKALAEISQQRDGGIGRHEIQKATDKVEWSVHRQLVCSQKERGARQWIRRFGSNLYFSYAKIRKLLDMPLESPKMRWWNYLRLNEVMAFINPGGDVHFKAGVYGIDASLELGSLIAYKGEGGITFNAANPTELVLDNGVNADLIKKKAASNTGWLFTGMTFDGNGANQAGVVGVMNLDNVNYVNILHSNLQWGKDYLIYCNNGGVIFCSHSHFEGVSDKTTAWNSCIKLMGNSSDSIFMKNDIIAGQSGTGDKTCDIYDDGGGNDLFLGNNLYTADYIIYCTGGTQRVFVGNRIDYAKRTNIYISGGHRDVVSGNLIVAGNQGAYADGYGLRLVNADHAIITSNAFYDSVPNIIYCIHESGTSNDNLIDDNVFQGYVTGVLVKVGATTKIGLNNIGYVNANSGSDSIASGTTSKVIAHGLSVTPSAEDFTIIGKEDPTNPVGTIWIDNIGAANFTVNVEADPGASNWDFGWKVIHL